MQQQQVDLHEENSSYCKGATTKTADDVNDFPLKLNIQKNKGDAKYCQVTQDLQEVESYDEEFSFSRAFNGVDTRRFSADDDAFYFKPVFPIFNHNNPLFTVNDGDCMKREKAKDVKKAFVKMPHINPNNLSEIALMTLANHKTEAEVAPKGNLNKKNNLSGFSKIWKFKGLIHRRKSDAVTSAQENYLRSRAMAEERQKAYRANHTMVVGAHSNFGADGVLTRKVHVHPY